MSYVSPPNAFVLRFVFSFLPYLAASGEVRAVYEATPTHALFILYLFSYVN
jgi:hypothetical protein